VKHKKTAKVNAAQIKQPHVELPPKLKGLEAEMDLGININNWKELGCLLNSLRLNLARCGHLSRIRK